MPHAPCLDGIRLRFFPCSDYNFAPEGSGYPLAVLASKWFVHFKGDTKINQPRYLEALRSGTF